MRGKCNWLRREMHEGELVDELTKLIFYCREGMNNQFMTVNVDHEQWRGLSLPLPLQLFRTDALKTGIKRVHANVGNQTRARRPLT